MFFSPWIGHVYRQIYITCIFYLTNLDWIARRKKTCIYVCVELLDREYYDPIDLTTWGKIEIADQTNEQLTAKACNQISSLMNQLIEYESEMEMKIEIKFIVDSKVRPTYITPQLSSITKNMWICWFFLFLDLTTIIKSRRRSNIVYAEWSTNLYLFIAMVGIKHDFTDICEEAFGINTIHSIRH